MFKNFLSILFVLLAFNHISAQNPPNITWKEINTEHFKVIFPQEISSDAQRTVNTLEHLYEINSKSLNIKVKKVPLVIMNQSTVSNAYGGLAPRMMGWYTNPMQSSTGLGITDWMTDLSMHEFRHIVQYQKTRTNFTKFMSFFYGDLANVFLNWSIPGWFYEGDAVYSETVLSNNGRGRTPQFDMPLRAIVLTKQRFSYDQAYLGSYNRFFPDIYHLGYPLVTYMRKTYGVDIFDKILNRTTKYSPWPFAFGWSVKRLTGYSLSANYMLALRDLDSVYRKQLSGINFTEATIINKKKKKVWTNYSDPIYLTDGTILARKAGLANSPALFKITPEGKEKKLMETDSEIPSNNGNTMVWARTYPDLRWSEQNFSDIVAMDLKTYKEQRLTKHKKYLAPAISPDGKHIATVEYNSVMKCRLLILDSKTAEIIDSLQFAGNDYIRTPAWNEQGNKIVFTHSNMNGIALSIYNTEDKKITTLLPHTWENISRPFFYNNYIIHNSEYSGIGNIYAINIQTKERFQIISRQFGAYHASLSSDKNKLLFQDYNISGYDIAEITLNPQQWKPLSEIKPNVIHYSEPLVAKEQGTSVVDSEDIPANKYPEQNFNRIKHAINIHSWGIFAGYNELQFLVLSNNLLKTTGIVAGTTYNVETENISGFAGMQITRFYPVFNFSTEFGKKREYFHITGKPDSVLEVWNEETVNTGMSIPFDLSEGVYTSGLTLDANYQFINVRNKNVKEVDAITTGHLSSTGLSLNYYRTLQSSYRDIYSPWAQTFSLSYKTTPFNEKWNGYLLSADLKLYTPGLFKHHSLIFEGAFEQQTKYNASNFMKLYYFDSEVTFFRGYERPLLDKMYRFSASYFFPISYPDRGLSPIFYCKRINGGFFMDYGKGYQATASKIYNSAGAQITFNLNFLRLDTELEIGLRYSAPLTNGDEPMINLILLGLSL